MNPRRRSILIIITMFVASYITACTEASAQRRYMHLQESANPVVQKKIPEHIKEAPLNADTGVVFSEIHGDRIAIFYLKKEGTNATTLGKSTNLNGTRVSCELKDCSLYWLKEDRKETFGIITKRNIFNRVIRYDAITWKVTEIADISTK